MKIFALILALLAPPSYAGIYGDSGGVIHPGGVYGNLAVGTSAVEVKVGASRAIGRMVVTILPVDETMWWGYSSAVTTSTGTPIFKNQLYVIMVNDQAPIYIISDATSKNARISESP